MHNKHSNSNNKIEKIKVGEILDVFADENVSIMNSNGETCQRDDVIGNEYTIKYKYKDGRDMDICYILNI